ncbi:hypothetical protein B0T17DRAFT_472880, partial [Bombardia bombarda]
HNYTTQLISFSPLVIYIHNFVSPSEATSLVTTGSALLQPSPVTGSGTGADLSQARTSSSAPMPATDHAVACVLSRAQAFLGTLLAPGRDDMGQMQMVRYTDGQKFDLHHDWFKRPRVLDADARVGRKRMYNRAATLFVTLQSNITGGGETWFPGVKAVSPQDRDGDKGGEGEERVWREHEEGGLAFKAVPGNAVFWVNLLEDGTGDGRTLHAGLPVEGGVKTALNIWPRRFFGPE